MEQDSRKKEIIIEQTARQLLQHLDHELLEGKLSRYSRNDANFSGRDFIENILSEAIILSEPVDVAEHNLTQGRPTVQRKMAAIQVDKVKHEIEEGSLSSLQSEDNLLKDIFIKAQEIFLFSSRYPST